MRLFLFTSSIFPPSSAQSDGSLFCTFSFPFKSKTAEETSMERLHCTRQEERKQTSVFGVKCGWKTRWIKWRGREKAQGMEEGKARSQTAWKKDRNGKAAHAINAFTPCLASIHWHSLHSIPFGFFLHLSAESAIKICLVSFCKNCSCKTGEMIEGG